MKDLCGMAKQWIKLCYIVILCSFCVGCQTSLPMVQPSTEPQVSASQVPEIILSHSSVEGTPEDIAAKAIKVKLQELLGDDAKVILYVDNQLGNAQEQLEALLLGRVHITIQPTTALSQYVDDLKVFSLPYLFSNTKEDALAVLNGSLETEVLERIAFADAKIPSGGSSFTGLGLWFGGYKLFTFYDEAGCILHSPANFCDRVMAVPNMPLLEAQYQRWGGKTIVADDAALYSTLAQHLADGAEATPQQIVSRSLHEVQHMVVQTYHSVEVYAVVANAAWYHALPSDVQRAVIEAQQYGNAVLDNMLEQETPRYLETISRTDGMCFYTLSEKEQAIFRQSVEQLYEEQLAGSLWQIGFVNRIRALYG